MKREIGVSSSDVKLLGFKLLGYYFFFGITAKTSSTIETKPCQFNSIHSIKTHFLHIYINIIFLASSQYFKWSLLTLLI
jgi:hypothetical protein